MVMMLIPVDHPFIKYIHNAEAVPFQDKDELGHDIRVFLCFIQHVQFVHTHCQAYISDFQGTICSFKSTLDLHYWNYFQGLETFWLIHK